MTDANRLNHPVLPGQQVWSNLDQRGNWLEFKETVAGTDRTELRQNPTGANQYPTIDPGTGIGGALKSLSYDSAGNLTFNRWARNMGDPCDRSPLAADCSTSGNCDPEKVGCNLGQEYEYDTENRLVRIWRDRNNAAGPLSGTSPEPKLMEFTYDALGRRVETIEYIDSATGATLADPRRTRHVYFGLEVIQEYTCGVSYSWCGSGPELVREFVHGDPERYPEVVAMIDHNGTGRTENVPSGGFVYHYLHDVLGSVVGLVNDAGTLVERNTYDPYGKPLIEKWDAQTSTWQASAEPASGLPYSPTGNPFMWTGHRYDPAVGLYHTLFRFYDPALGRWLQRDCSVSRQMRFLGRLL